MAKFKDIGIETDSVWYNGSSNRNFAWKVVEVKRFDIPIPYIEGSLCTFSLLRNHHQNGRILRGLRARLTPKEQQGIGLPSPYCQEGNVNEPRNEKLWEWIRNRAKRKQGRKYSKT